VGPASSHVLKKGRTGDQEESKGKQSSGKEKKASLQRYLEANITKMGK